MALKAVGRTWHYAVVVQGWPSNSLGGMAPTPSLTTVPGPQPPSLQMSRCLDI